MKSLFYLALIASCAFVFKYFYEDECVNFVGKQTKVIYEKIESNVESADILTKEYVKKNVGLYYAGDYTNLVLSMYNDEKLFEHSSRYVVEDKVNKCKREKWTRLVALLKGER